MQDTAVLVSSCDRYADLWVSFFGVFRRRWPDCPFPVYLGSNHKVFPDTSIRSVTVGEDITWAANLRAMLDAIPEPWIILMLEDFFLIDDVDSNAVLFMQRVAAEQGLACLRLMPNPPPSRPLRGRANLGTVLPGEPYRVSTQTALWSADFLRRIALPQFSAWQFETFGTLLSDRMGVRIWGVMDPVIRTRHGVERGLWMRRGLTDCGRARAVVDLTGRGVMTDDEFRLRRQQARTAWGGVKAGLMRLMPPALRRCIRRHRPRPRLRQLLRQVKADITPTCPRQRT